MGVRRTTMMTNSHGRKAQMSKFHKMYTLQWWCQPRQKGTKDRLTQESLPRAVYHWHGINLNPTFKLDHTWRDGKENTENLEKRIKELFRVQAISNRITLHWQICFLLTVQFSSVHFSSVAQSGPTLWDPMGCSTPGFAVHHNLLELAQTHAHWVSNTIQTSHALLFPSLSVFNLSQHQGSFQGVSSLHEVAKVFELQLQHQSFQSVLRTDFL